MLKNELPHNKHFVFFQNLSLIAGNVISNIVSRSNQIDGLYIVFNALFCHMYIVFSLSSKLRDVVKKQLIEYLLLWIWNCITKFD